MNLFYRLSALCFVMLLLLTSLRFVVFSSYMHSQKAAFRAQLLGQRHKTRQLKIERSRLYVNSGGYQWKDKNHELVMGGVYYEIKSIAQQGKYCVLQLVEDKVENKLFAAFFKSHAGAAPDVLKLLLCLIFIGALPYSLTSGSRPVHYFRARFSIQRLFKAYRTIKPPEILFAG